MIIERPYYLERIHSAWKSLPLVVLNGARQVGKTTLMRSIGFGGDQVFLNGQDPEVAAVFQQHSTLTHFLRTRLNKDLDGSTSPVFL